MAKPRVLIVEDDDISIFVLKKMLGDAFDVQVAKNSGEARSILKEGKQHSLVLMDINLGEEHTNGTQLMQELKNANPGSIPTFIAVTSYAMAGDREYFLDQGFEDYIPKPVDRHHLLNTIEAYLEN